MVDKIVRGDVCFADLSPVGRKVSRGKTPCPHRSKMMLGNHFSTTVIVAAITAKDTKLIFQHIEIKDQFGFERDSVVFTRAITDD